MRFLVFDLGVWDLEGVEVVVADDHKAAGEGEDSDEADDDVDQQLPDQPHHRERKRCPPDRASVLPELIHSVCF
eukprot:960443-Rhodomonas_salina.1